MIPSIFERSPSKIKIKGSIPKNIVKTASLFLMISLVVIAPPIKIGIASIIVRSAMFEPKTFPYDSAGLLSIADTMPTISSGRDVAKAITRKLIVYSDILKCLESLDVDVIIQSTALTRRIEKKIPPATFKNKVTQLLYKFKQL